MTPKPCPLCGQPPLIGSEYSPKDHSCDNAKCLLYGIYFNPETWNTRPAEDAIISRITSEIERLSMHYKTDALEQLKERILKP